MNNKSNGKEKEVMFIVQEHSSTGVIVDWRCVTIRGHTTQEIENKVNDLKKSHKRVGSNSNKIVPIPFHT